MKNKKVYLLLTVIIVLLVYLIFKDDIANRSKREEIAKKASIFNIPVVALSLGESLLDTGSDGFQKDTSKLIVEYGNKAEAWQSMIRTRENISCSDFSDGREAFDFFDYVSGEIVPQIKAVGITDSTNYGLIYLNYRPVCNNDPYGLDTNHDCWPCKNFNY